MALLAKPQASHDGQDELQEDHQRHVDLSHQKQVHQGNIEHSGC
jgi:hypothetical protein